MLLSEAKTAVAAVVNNPSIDATEWIKSTLREIGGRGRWFWLVKHVVAPVAPYLALPTDLHEIYEPLYLDTSATSLVYITTTSLPAGLLLSPYSTTLQAGTVATWTTPSAPWLFELKYRMERGKGHYRVSSFGLELHNAFTSGGQVWMSYYRNITIPTATTEALDLPDDFVYNLIVYGAARHGLLQEDDYDRLRYAQDMFESTLKKMVEWDSRRKVANGWEAMRSRTPYQAPLDVLIWPSNFSVR